MVWTEEAMATSQQTTMEQWCKYGLQTRSIRLRDDMVRIFTRGKVASWADLVRLAEDVRRHDQRARSLWSPLDVSFLSSIAKMVMSQRVIASDLDDGLAVFDAIQAVSGDQALAQNNRLAICDAISELGRHEDLVQAISKYDIASFNPKQAALLAANAYDPRHDSETALWLQLVNAALSEDDLSPVDLSSNRGPTLDNLSCITRPGSVEGPLVTAIVPTHNPGPEIYTAVRSLILQTWANLEILVMDDASDPEYKSGINALEDLDPRITVVHSSPNRGSYFVRNLAVSQYTHGDFITVHDDDGWSHADKIAFQMAYLLDTGKAGVTCNTIGVTDNCRFLRMGEPISYTRMSYASYMVQRSIFRHIGYWEPLRGDADRGFLLRLQSWQSSAVPLLGKTPWIFQRVRADSLSNGEVARGYIASSCRWHEWLDISRLAREKSTGRRLYQGVGLASQPNKEPYALQRLLPNTPTPLYLNDIVMAHWGKENPDLDKAIEKVRELRQSGHTVGLVHVDSPYLGVAEGISADLMDLIEDDDVFILSMEDDVSVETAWVLEPSGCWLAESPEPKLKVQKIVCPCGKGTEKCYLKCQIDIAE